MSSRSPTSSIAQPRPKVPAQRGRRARKSNKQVKARAVSHDDWYIAWLRAAEQCASHEDYPPLPWEDGWDE